MWTNMSENPQVEEAKRSILEQRIYERQSNTLYVFPHGLESLSAGVLARARAEDTTEKHWLSIQSIPVHSIEKHSSIDLAVTVSRSDADDLARYGCVVFRRKKSGVEARIWTWVLRTPDALALMNAPYEGRTINSIGQAMNAAARQISETRHIEGDIDFLSEGWRFLGVSPDRINKILSPHTDLRQRRYLHDARILKLWEQQGLCPVCKHRIEIDDVTYDHWFPESAGGRSDWNNMVILHPACNVNKGNRIPPGLENNPLWTPPTRQIQVNGRDLFVPLRYQP